MSFDCIRDKALRQMQQFNVTKSHIMITVITLWLLLLPCVAQATVVAIMFDDSGSMKGKIQLPAFGAQLLVSSLNGISGGDRLITARMSSAGNSRPVEEQDISSERAVRKLIKQISEKWTNPSANTPYIQISFLLEKIAEIQKTGEDAYLIILTDGEFVDELPDRRVLSAYYEDVKQRLKGPLHVDFLLIGADQASREFGPSMTIGDVVETQGVRQSLLETFNERPKDGQHDVNNTLELTRAIREIIVQVAAVDPKVIERFLVRSENSIEINSPLSISRIVTVATGSTKKALEKPNGPSLGTSNEIAFVSKMLANDSLSVWRNTKLMGETRHMAFDPPLAAGKNKLAFDGDPSKTLMMLQTQATLNLFFADEDGKYIQPNNGVVSLYQHTPVKLFAEVHDRVGQKIVTVPWSNLGQHAKISAKRDLSSSSVQLDAQVDDARDLAFFDFSTTELDQGQVSSIMKVNGLKAFSKPVHYRILSSAADVEIQFVSESHCDACDAKTIRRKIQIHDTNQTAGHLETTVKSPLSGTITLKLSSSENRVSFAKNQKQLETTLAVSGQGSSRLRTPIYFSGPTDDLIAEGIQRIDISVSGIGGGKIHGSAEQSAILELEFPDPKLELVSHSQGGKDGAPLVLDVEKLNTGQEFVDLQLLGVINSDGKSKLTFESDAQVKFTHDPSYQEAQRFFAEPKYPCLCYLYFRNGQHEVNVFWQDEQNSRSAKTSFTIEMAVTLEQALRSCLFCLLLILLALYVIRGFIFSWKTQVFPRHSGVDVRYENDEDPRFVAFPTGFWTKLLAFLFPFGNRNQKVRVEGLFLEAIQSGAAVDIKRSEKSYRFSFIALTLDEMLEEAPRKENYIMKWNESAESWDLGYRGLILLRKPSDRVQ